MNHAEMQQRLETIQQEAEQIKKALAKSYPSIQEAKPGDLLEDGTVVIEKYGNAALIAAPSITECRCTWSKEFSDVFEALKSQGFNPSQWFIPSQEQLKLAYKNAKPYFSSTHYWSYWSSTEASSTDACHVHFLNGDQFTCSKTFTSCVRAFRLVTF
jgi:hypothetical protein